MAEARPLLGIVLMVLAGLCFAGLDATSKTLSQTFSVPLLVWARYAFHCLLMVVFLAPSMGLRLVSTRRPLLQVVRALLLVGITGCAMAAFRVMPLAEATAILFVTPLAVALLAGPCLGERIGLGRWLAVAAGFGGVLLIVRPGGDLPAEGIAFALAGAACYAAYQIQTRMLSPTENTWTMLFYTALVGTAAMSLALPFIWEGPLPDWREAMLIASLGIYGGTGHFLLIRAFRHAPASLLAPYLYTQLIWAGLLGWLFFGQFPDAVSLAGMGVVAAASIGMTLWERHAARRAAAA
ncbi:MAG: DMT family transporter [Sterolibacteriaceae bacterium MAG5]|nr:DMT family transporter [Candidatus Nitricoxidireducens bremensis]